MAKVAAMVTVLSVVGMLTACNGSDKTAASAVTKKNEAEKNTEKAIGAQKKESKAGAVSVSGTESLLVVGDSEYAGLSMEELYEKALEEGGQVNIYSETSKCNTVVENFMKDYPGIKAEYNKQNSTNQMSLIPAEVDSGNLYADIMICGDVTGTIYNEYYSKGYVQAYYPVCVKEDAWDPEYSAYGVPLSLENYIWFYSTDAFPEGSPVNNWWDIVELDENGKSRFTVYTYDLDTANIAAFFSSWSEDPSELEQAYYNKYGSALEYTYDGSALGIENGNAVYEWAYRLLQGDVHYIDDDDQSLKKVADSTADAPVISFQSGIKLGDAQEDGVNVDYCTGLDPFSCFGKPKYVYLLSDTDNPYAARLFINYMFGGEDYKYGNLFVQRSGAFALLSDYDNSKYNTYSLEDLAPYAEDLDYAYNHYLEFEDFAIYYFDQLH